MSPSSILRRSNETARPETPMLIGGAWRAASDSYEVRDLCRNTVVARAPRSPLSDPNDVLDAAVAAKAKAAATLLVQRVDHIGEVMALHDGRMHGAVQLLAEARENGLFWR